MANIIAPTTDFDTPIDYVLTGKAHSPVRDVPVGKRVTVPLSTTRLWSDVQGWADGEVTVSNGDLAGLTLTVREAEQLARALVAAAKATRAALAA